MKDNEKINENGTVQRNHTTTPQLQLEKVSCAHTATFQDGLGG